MSGAKPYRQTYWDWRAAGNFIFGGTGSGLLVLAAFLAYGQGSPGPHVLAGLGFIGLGLSMVWLEIGKKLRAMNVFRHPHMSWMTRESYAATMVFIAGGIALWSNGTAGVLITAIFAALFLYSQGRILLASKGIPAWREKTIVSLIMTTGLTEGLCAIILITHLFALPHSETVFTAAFLALVNLLILRIFYWGRYRRSFNKSAPLEAIKVYDRFHRPFLYLANILPIIMLVLALVHIWKEPLILMATILALVGGWAFKFVLITRASYTQGFAIPHRPARGPRGSSGPGTKPGWQDKS